MAATPTRRSGTDLNAAPAAFSYAQAAKGLSSSAASVTASSKPASGAITPSKDATSGVSTTLASSALNWADDTEVDDLPHQKPSVAQDTQINGTAPPKQAATLEQPAASIVSSPDLAGSSSSTAIKDDDVSSIQNPSSESTWENKSQASTSVDKSTDSGEQTADTIKAKDQDRVSYKTLTEAPVPAVNIWKQRAEEIAAKAKATQKPSIPKPSPASSTPVTTNGVSQGSNTAATKKGKINVGADGLETREKGSSNDGKAKSRDEDKNPHTRKESRSDGDFEKSKKQTKAKTTEKEVRPVANSIPLPPTRDQESWPTPDSAIDDNKKKAQEKGEKVDKERNSGASTRSHGKQEWVTVPYTPNVIFNTPLPSTAPGRRGGRGGGRGGAQSGGRGAAYSSANGVGSTEKETPTSTALPNGEQSKRGRPDGSTTQDASPTRDKRTVSAESASLKENKAPGVSGERNAKVTPGSEAETPSRRNSTMTEPVSTPQLSGQNTSFPRQHPSTRPNKARRGDPPGERRKDLDLASPTKENGESQGRSTTQPDVSEGPDRRASVIQDNQNGQSKPGVNERRGFGSFSGRGRERGAPRGGRGTYQNGHQFTNGQSPIQHGVTFPLRSPTTFHPDQANFYPGVRNYRAGHRSQSVTTENIYGRVPGFAPSHQGVPPISTFMGPAMYDYTTMPPMSAVPYSPFSVDQYTLVSMVTTQLEYYFSVENLCKDIFLRKHMDSKGFVFLSVIAEFNRIKQLTTDLELIKFVCYQSRVIEFRVGQDGKDRLRRHEGWEQWVLAKSERDPSAQNDGPDELHNPPIPHPAGFEHPGMPRYPEMSTMSPTGPVPLGSDVPYPGINGTLPGISSNTVDTQAEGVPNGQVVEGQNGISLSNGPAVEASAQIVNNEPDSFSDEQVETLSVIVRKQDQASIPNLPLSATRTFSNGSIDSRSGVPDESENLSSRLSSLKVNGTGPSQGVEKVQEEPRRSASPFSPSTAPAMNPVRLYWVKGKESPVESLPADSTYESYTHLRSKALDQRQKALPGTCPYDMDVLYQFWSHFLIRNFNSRMYDEFRLFAFEDAAQKMSDVGLRNLIKYYGESLLSPQNLIRERVARHYVDLVASENEGRRPAFKQLRSAWRNGALNLRNRKRIGQFLDEDLKASLEL